MKKITIVAVAVLAYIPAITWAGESHQPVRPVHTYSIVARDAATGELGAVVQSHWFSVGSGASWYNACRRQACCPMTRS